MATAAGLWDHHLAAQQVRAQAAPSAGTNQDSNSTSDNSATISANDFLTLLVTEMQNQDPTADTDPNEYINQLVSVNSLEQLISIDQTVTGALGSSTSSGSTSDSVTGGGAKQGVASADSVHASAARTAPGNLSIPASSAASQRVAQALNGRHTSSQF